MSFFLRNVSLEDDTSGTTQVEREHIIWARVSDINQLHDAEEAEKQTQVSILAEKTDHNFVEGVVRIRRTEEKGKEPEYTLTIKQHHERSEGKTETSIPATEDAFVQLCGLATERIEKHRYKFPVEGTDLVWEMDVAPNGKGGYHDWVRLELEVEDFNAPLPKFPVNFSEVVMPPQLNGLPEDEWSERNRELFDMYFVTKGPLVQYKHEEVEDNSVASDAEGDDTVDDTETESNGEDTDESEEDSGPQLKI